jgi:predicted  nucleic acid-binding Zn-ribbon protein
VLAVARDVAPAHLARLLDLQDQDTAIRLLDHRRQSLPEAQRLTEVKERVAELDADLEIAEQQRGDAAREQSRSEGEIELLDRKIEREEKRLFSGQVANPKELGALQAEVAMLKGRRAQLEDGLLEVMVRRDQIEETIAKLQAERGEAAAEAADLGERVGRLTAEIDAELADHSGRRAAIAPELPADLLATYDQIRATRGGVGAAPLVAGQCQGCHTKLPAREVEQMRAEGGLQRCESCRRILVVT